jgi:hypothetical protein
MNQREIFENLDLGQFDIDGIVDEVEIATCDRISSKFIELKKKAEAQSNDEEVLVYSTLAMVTSFHFKSEDQNQPFSPQMTTSEWRSAIPDDFTDPQLDYLHNLMNHITNPELISRIGDTLWVRRRNFNCVKSAIKNYMLSADQLKDKEVIYSVDRLERALRLSISLGKGAGELAKKVEEEIAKYIDFLGYENTFSVLKLIGLLHDYRRGDFSKYTEITKNFAEAAETKNDWHRARECWHTNIKCNQVLEEEKNIEHAKLKVAETHVKESEAATSKMVEASFLQKAITAYRRVGKQGEKLKDLHRKLLETQKDINKELGSFSHDIDISKIVNYSRENVKGKSLREAIHSLCLMIRPIIKSDTKVRVQKLINEHPLNYMISGVLMDEEGKTIAEYPNILAGTDEDREAALLAHMHRETQYGLLTSVNGIIEPARKQILLEHPVQENDFYDIVRSSPLVPPGREYFFAKGIYQGFLGDFVSAINTLVTQFEHSIRYILKSNGVITSGIDDQNRQDDRSLNATLYVDEIEDTFGEDIVFTLRNILTERFGGNLRNKVAHGLMWPNSYFSQYSIFFWAFLLRLIFWPEIVEKYDAEQSAAEGDH